MCCAMPEPPDYAALETAEWRHNARAIPEELRTGSPRLLTRIRLFMARFGFLESEVKEKVRTDPMFAAHFAKEPRRTGLHERVAAQWIRALPLVHGFRVLPKDGAGAIYVTGDGNIHHGDLANRPGKSLDFTWTTGATTCYAMHKYTKQEGGTQDQANIEMTTILRNFQSCNVRTCALFVVVDGPYWAGARIQALRDHLRTSAPKSYAIPIEDLPAILDTYRA